MKIYFAGAIRGGRDNQQIYMEIVKLLAEYGEVLTEHIGDSSLTVAGEKLPDKEIRQRDLGFLTESSLMVAEVTTPSLGVGYEIGRAEGMGKPVLCLFRTGGDRKLSAMVNGNDGLMVREYKNPEDLKEILKNFFSENPKGIYQDTPQ